MRIARLLLGMPLQLPIPQYFVLAVIARPGSVFARQEKFTPTSPMPASPACARSLPSGQRPCRNATRAARLVGSVASQLHAVRWIMPAVADSMLFLMLYRA